MGKGAEERGEWSEADTADEMSRPGERIPREKKEKREKEVSLENPQGAITSGPL